MTYIMTLLTTLLSLQRYVMESDTLQFEMYVSGEGRS